MEEVVNEQCEHVIKSPIHTEKSERVSDEGSPERISEHPDSKSTAPDCVNDKPSVGKSCCKVVCAERDKLKNEMEALLVQEQSMKEVTKELERKLLLSQDRLEDTDEQLAASLKKQTHLEVQLEEVTTQRDKAKQEQDDVLGKLSLLEIERGKLIDESTTTERKLKETTKVKERLELLTAQQKSDITRLQNSFNKSEKSCSELSRENGRLREEVGSLNIKVKWAQNKLKSETDTHKECKAALILSNKKLKESREEGEQIRADLKRMIQQYQESEEMRSNSLGLKLQKTEKELKAQEQEIVDQQELHELTVKELELTKASCKIAQQEVARYKSKVAELSAQNTTQASEVEELKRALEKIKCEQNQLSFEKTELDGIHQTLESERIKFSALREAFTSMQKSCQHLEREVGRHKDRETELLAFTEKLSSANAELTAQRSITDAKILSLTSERDSLVEEVAVAGKKSKELQQVLTELTQSSQLEVERLSQQVENKSRAVEELSLSLEDEREMVKATRKKNASNIRDLQRQLQQSKRRIDHLETTLAAEREAPATLPVTNGSHTSSQDSLNEIPTHDNHPASATLTPHTQVLSDEERAAASPSPELLFQNMDSEKLMLVERLCRHKKELARLEEKIEFFEEHTTQLTDDIQRKSKILQSFILREQSGTLAPAAHDEHKARHVKKGGVMATVFTGGKAKGHREQEMTFELSLEMNRKMQSVLEDTLLKNITLKESIDTLGSEIQRLSARLQVREDNRRR